MATTPNPTLVPFQAEHLRYLINRDTGEVDPWTLALQKQEGGIAMTGLNGDIILGCAGVVCPWPGVGAAWMVLSDQIGGHGLWMTKMVRHFLDDIIRCHGLHRIEAVVLVENERNQRWIERLGFTREHGRARAYTSDRQDVIRYEWIRESG